MPCKCDFNLYLENDFGLDWIKNYFQLHIAHGMLYLVPMCYGLLSFRSYFPLQQYPKLSVCFREETITTTTAKLNITTNKHTLQVSKQGKLKYSPSLIIFNNICILHSPVLVLFQTGPMQQ